MRFLFVIQPELWNQQGEEKKDQPAQPGKRQVFKKVADRFRRTKTGIHAFTGYFFHNLPPVKFNHVPPDKGIDQKKKKPDI